ncbi:trypsin-like serine peptidase [Sphaerimonospora mesophila]|uniref:trypsin-like serine peptidase n=1 Tax=Sphaerimonospora mesophila TaxID=37483 RepID=UPI0007C7F454
MKRTLAFGGIVASAGMLAAGLAATPAQAAGDVASDTLANTNLAAQQVAMFWYGENKANLLNAKPYAVETKVSAKHVSGGGPSADTKPGVVPAIGDEKKTASKSKNVNLPKTTGKVFFIGADGNPHWCSATSVQSSYRNLVATAGHCVYDTESNKATMDKWVFIPGYYQGKTPWGIYVGKTAYTHYDFDVYEDGDRDYAFVTVYNGVLPDGAWGSKDWKSKSFKKESHAKYWLKKLQNDKKTGYSDLQIVATPDMKQKVKLGTPDSTKVEPASVADLAVDPATVNGARTTLENQAKQGTSTYSDGTWGVTVKRVWRGQEGWNSTDPAKQTVYTFKKDGKTYQATFWGAFKVKDYVITGKILRIGLKDVGRLGDNVGGQGLAYNQKLGKAHFVFGYPSGSHPDGNHAYTGKTLKWAYGKTFAATAPAIKGEELQGIKSSFTGEGSLGSAWLLNYKSAKRIGYLNGVTIAVADRDGNKRIDTSLSPYFDGETYGVYASAAKNWSGKIV